MDFSKKIELLDSLNDPKIAELEGNIKKIRKKLDQLEEGSFEYNYFEKKLKKANILKDELAELVLKDQQNHHNLTVIAFEDFIHS